MQLEEESREKNHRQQEIFEQKQLQLQEEFEKKSALVDERELDLLQKTKEIDDRDNTHARRQIRDKMLADVKSRIENFGVSTATEAKRKPVQRAIFTLLALFLLSISLSAFELYKLSFYEFDNYRVWQNTHTTESQKSVPTFVQNPQDTISEKTIESRTYLLWGRLTLSTFGAIGTLLFYIKWINKWAQQHSDSEFQLQQFHIDVNRANWLMESCLEWRKETSSPIPTELLKSMTRGLFAHDKGDPDQVIHPADELASALMGSASKLKLKIGENELEMNPKKIPDKVAP